MAAQKTNEMALNVQESLTGTPYACSRLDQLAGGTANFVYRGTLKTRLEDGSETVIVKHTEGFSASNRDFKLGESRCDYERTILESLHSFPPLLDSGILIQTPHLYHFSPSSHTQIYTDLSSSLDLKTYVLTHASSLTRSQYLSLGHALGKWSKGFHVWAANNNKEGKELRTFMKGNKAMRDLKFMVNYEILVITISRFPGILEEKRDVFVGVREGVKRELEENEGELIHGDFWSGNVLLKHTPSSFSDTTFKIFIIDWEMSQLSLPAFDLGQMIAELYELKHFKDYEAGIWMIEGFLEGYGEMSEEMRWKTVIHAGTHLVCWGSRVPGWGSEEQVEDVVRVGRNWVVGGWERDRKAFEGTVLGRWLS